MGFDWGKIGSGPKFHALVTALLLQDDPKTRVFNRAGKDGAIDALSSDRKTVFQSKYHHAGTSKHAFADAAKELKQIAKYQKPGAAWYPIWKDVTTWRLMTNVPFGTQDEIRWRDEVVPAFAAQDLIAEYRIQSHLEKDLTTHRDIAAAYFGDRPRLFVSLHEHREALLGREVLERSYDVQFEGREAELTSIRDFVTTSPHQVLLIYGPGGVGKSRFAYEAASKLLADGTVETVYCGTAHLPNSQDWYLGIVPETRALVLLDEPTDPDFIQRFLTELRSRTKQWKAIIAVRSQRDPVVATLRDPRERLLAEPIDLRPLPEDVALRYASALLAPLAIPVENRPGVERWLVKVCGGFPIWMTVATQLLETKTDLKNLPADTFKIAATYVRDVIDHTGPEIGNASQVLSLLRWVALTQPISREHGEGLKYVAARCGFPNLEAVDRALEDLGRRRIVTLYGINRRMVEIRPDVLRDHLLVDWLTYDNPPDGRRPSADAQQLATFLAAEASAANPGPFTSRIIPSLGRLEFAVEPRIPFLDPFADAVVDLAKTAADTVAQSTCLELLPSFALFRPRKIAAVSELIRGRDVPAGMTSGWLSKSVTRSQVLAELPWELYRAAHTCESTDDRRAILRELVELIELQGDRAASRRGNTGKTAAEVLPRVLHERHEYQSSFQPEGAALAGQFLARIGKGEPPRESWRILIGALLTLERHDTYRTEPQAHAVTFERFTLAAEDVGAQAAVAIRTRLWSLVETHGPMTPAKTFAWSLLDEFHRSLNAGDAQPEWRALVVDDLSRASAIANDGAFSLDEIQAARTLWDWHRQFEEDPEVRALADACEAAYLKHPLVSRYAPMFGSDHLDVEERLKATTAAVEAVPTDELPAFFTGAFAFTGTHSEKWRDQQVYSFAGDLGRARRGDAHAAAFVDAEVANGVSAPLFGVALSIVAGALSGLRADGDEALVEETLDRLMSVTPDDETRKAVVSALFVAANRPVAARFGAVDRRFLAKHWLLLKSLPTTSYFFMLGRLLRYDAANLETARTDVNALEESARLEAILSLWRGYWDTLPFPATPTDVSVPIIDLLLDLLSAVPNLGGSHGHVDWEIQELLKRTPKKPLSWIVGVVRTRLALFRERNQRAAEAAQFEAHVRILPNTNEVLMAAVEKLGTQPPTMEQQRALNELFELADEPSIGLYLAHFAIHLDPHGTTIPNVIVDRLRDPLQAADRDGVATWAEYAGWYAHGSAPWRVIALATCTRIAGWSNEDTMAIYSTLRSRHSQGWIGTPGELHPRWQSAVDVANQALVNETEPALQPYWASCVAIAERDVERERARLEEREF